jgi:hypothetical protein
MKLFGVFALMFLAGSLSAQAPVLFVYDEHNEALDPYIQMVKDELVQHKIAFEETSAQEVRGQDLSRYSSVVIYSAVMAFSLKSPVRDWLGSHPNLNGKRVAMLMTAHSMFLDTLKGQQTKLLKDLKTQEPDVVASATKDLGAAQKRQLVKEFVSRI